MNDLQDAVTLADELEPVSVLIRKRPATRDPELAAAWEVTMVQAMYHCDVRCRAEAIERLFELYEQMQGARK